MFLHVDTGRHALTSWRKSSPARALDALPFRYREVLICRDIQGLNIAETAQLLGISEASVKTRLLRARLRMRDALAPGFDGAWIKGRSHEKVRPW